MNALPSELQKVWLRQVKFNVPQPSKFLGRCRGHKHHSMRIYMVKVVVFFFAGGEIFQKFLGIFHMEVIFTMLRFSYF